MSNDGVMEARRRSVRFRATGSAVRHVGHREMAELRTSGHRLKSPGVAEVGRAGELGNLGSRCERVGRTTDSAAVARGAVEAVRAARHVA